jgi:hypothetical protein
MLICALEVLDESGTYLILVVDGSPGQIDEPRSNRAGQCRRQIVGLYPIISSSRFNDHVVDLDEFFGVARAVIFVNQSRLELV